MQQHRSSLQGNLESVLRTSNKDFGTKAHHQPINGLEPAKKLSADNYQTPPKKVQTPNASNTNRKSQKTNRSQNTSMFHGPSNENAQTRLHNTQKTEEKQRNFLHSSRNDHVLFATQALGKLDIRGHSPVKGHVPTSQNFSSQNASKRRSPQPGGPTSSSKTRNKSGIRAKPNDQNITTEIALALEVDAKKERQKLNQVKQQFFSSGQQDLQEQLQSKDSTIRAQAAQIQALKDELGSQKEENHSETVKYQKFQQIILNENKALSRQILVLTEMYYEQHRDLQKSFNDRNYEAAGLKSHHLFDESVLDFKRKHEEACQQIAALESKLLSTSEQFLSQNDQKQKRIEDLLQQSLGEKKEKKLLVNQMNSLRKDLAELASTLEEVKSEKERLALQQDNHSSSAEVMESYRAANQRQAAEIREMRLEMQNLESLIEQFKQENGKTSGMYQEKDSEIEFLQEEISTLMNEKQEKETIIKTLTQENLRLSSELLEQDQEESIAEIQQQEIQYLSGQLSSFEKHTSSLEQRVGFLQCSYEESQTQLENLLLQQHDLFVQINEREQELERVSDCMADLQRTNFVYAPVKDDPIDRRLAEYINNKAHHKASLFFVRESNGIYSYGRKRLMMKIENDQIIMRVGGGFLTIDNFIDTYSPQEIRKRQKNQFSNLIQSSTFGTRGSQKANPNTHNSSSRPPRLMSHTNYTAKEISNFNCHLNQAESTKGLRLAEDSDDIIAQSTEGEVEEMPLININI